jgi:glutamine amidotransferase
MKKKFEKLVVIIDYGMGNVGSVKNALDSLGVSNIISTNPKDLEKATHIILPGVGAFKECVKNLKKAGFIEVLCREVLNKKKPYLGICLGMQILSREGEEGGSSLGLGFVKGQTRKFKVDEKKFHLPHVGWNDVAVKQTSRLFVGINRPIFYFVHSFHFVPTDKNIISGQSEYGEKFASAIEDKNIFGVQFHPEKSQKAGLQLLENFLNV